MSTNIHGKKHQRRTTTQRAALEALEQRQLLSASVDTVSLNPATGIVSVIGTKYSDQIYVSIQGEPATNFTVWLDGQKTVYPLAEVKGLYVDSGAGNDLIQIKQSHAKVWVPATLVGGSGNDTIQAGSGPSFIAGGKGQNLLIAGPGASYVTAADGNNDVIGHNNDAITLGNGNNMVSCGLDSIVHAGTGTNHINSGGAELASPEYALNSAASPELLNTTIVGYTPGQIEDAYNISQLSNLTGAGQTIAIVDPYDDPTIFNDLTTFSGALGLPAPTETGANATFEKVYASGVQPMANATWDAEIALDVEWAHAIAPGAKIVLVEANSNLQADLSVAVTRASEIVEAAGGGVVSMSFGTPEATASLADDATFMSAAYANISFIAAAGDDNELVYPAVSPYVTDVGGTTLDVNQQGYRVGPQESAWAMSSGGYSVTEPLPAYQDNLVIGGVAPTARACPDVALDGNPATGVVVYSSTAMTNGVIGYSQIGGTSLSTVIMAGIVALSDQLRVKDAMPEVGNTLQTQIYNMGYNEENQAYFDITTGAAGANAAGPGFDLASGWGVPIADNFVDLLAGTPATAVPSPDYGTLDATLNWGGYYNESMTNPLILNQNARSSFNGGGSIVGGVLTLTMENGFYNNDGNQIEMAPDGNTGTAGIPTVFALNAGYTFGDTYFTNGTVTAAGPLSESTLDIEVIATVGTDPKTGVTGISGNIYTIDANGNEILQGIQPIFEAQFG